MPRRGLPSILLCCAFFLNGLTPVWGQTVLNLPAPGTRLSLSAAYEPLLVKGLKIHPENPFLFDFLMDSGQSSFKTDSVQLRTESQKLIKYFLASLAIPENNLWVNLSPYEKDRIVPNELGQTVLGQDMLAQDYILKQLTASLIYPENRLGKEFWGQVYKKASALHGTTSLPVNTFNKVWIVADKANVYVNNNTAFVVGSHLKVMLEEDYLALSRHSDKPNSIASHIIKDIILPQLETEINTGKNFATLRQIFHSMILATWYKNNLKETLLNQVYANKDKIRGVETADKAIKEKIYEQYLKAYKKGVFNLIKDEAGPSTGQPTPKKYFSGGLTELAMANVVPSGHVDVSSFTEASQKGSFFDAQIVLKPQGADAAMYIKIPVDWAGDIVFQIKHLPQLNPDIAIEYAHEFLAFMKERYPEEFSSALEHARRYGKDGLVIAVRDLFIALNWNISPEYDGLKGSSAVLKTASSWTIENYPDWGRELLKTLDGLSIAVTGGSGDVAGPTIGQAFRYGVKEIRSFERVGHQRPQNEKDKLRSLASNPAAKYETVTGDLRAFNSIKAAIENVDMVIHLGGVSTVSIKNPAVAFETNLRGTLNLINVLRQTALETGKKPVLVIVSTSQVGDAYLNAYKASKIAVERVAQELCEKYEIPYTILRPTQIGGTFEEAFKNKEDRLILGETHRRFLKNIFHSAVTQEDFPITGSKESRLGFISYRDVADGILIAGAQLIKWRKSQIVNLAPKETLALGETIQRAENYVSQKGVHIPVKEPPIPFSPSPQARLDAWEAIKALGGWRARTGIEEILQHAADFELENRDMNILDDSEQEKFNPSIEARALNRIFNVLRVNWQLDKRSVAELLAMPLAFSAVTHTERTFEGRQRPATAVEQKLLNLVLEEIRLGPHRLLIRRHVHEEFTQTIESYIEELDKIIDDKDLDKLIKPYENEQRLKLFEMEMQDVYREEVRRRIDEEGFQNKRENLPDGIKQEYRLYVERMRFVLEIAHILGTLDAAKGELPEEEEAKRLMNLAMTSKPGGIDLNAKSLKIDVSGVSPGIPVGFDPAMALQLENGDFTGLAPVILKVTPLNSLLPLLEAKSKSLPDPGGRQAGT